MRNNLQIDYCCLYKFDANRLQLEGDMPRKKLNEKDKVQFQNVGLLKEDHDMLRKLAEQEQRSMARQLSVIIRKSCCRTATCMI